jgi:hypothetical protein
MKEGSPKPTAFPYWGWSKTGGQGTRFPIRMLLPNLVRFRLILLLLRLFGFRLFTSTSLAPWSASESYRISQ